jgi:LacI family transcriptional regulator
VYIDRVTRKRRPTIVDVAEAAEVSVATVSYVLSGKRPIGKPTQDRVRKAIRKLGYRPNPNAQGLRAVQSFVIAVIVSDWRESILLPMLQGVESVARERGYHLNLNSLEEFDNDLASAVDFLSKKAVDGMLYISGIASEEPLKLPRTGTPRVGVNRPLDKRSPAVLCDNTDGGYRAARHLLEQGCLRPAVIAGPMERAANRNRLEGFREALNEHGVVLPDSLIYTGDFEAPSGAAGFAALMSRPAPPDGIFCTNDAMAAGALSRAAEDDVPVPQKVKIIGFDNERFDPLLPIPLSSFEVPGTEMARTAAETLIAMVEASPIHFEKVRVRSTLHPRKSTARLNE